MRITDTQLAAALISSGHELLPTDFDSNGVVFQFGDSSTVVTCQKRWHDMSRQGHTNGDSPLEIMFKVSKAREWMLKQVVHGHHNQALTVPGDAFPTYELHVAVSLVAKGCYLLKLDKQSRRFYFAGITSREYDDYKLPSEWYRHARVYLDVLDGLVRRIHNRNLTRQAKQDAITCSGNQSVTPNPLKGILRHA